MLLKKCRVHIFRYRRNSPSLQRSPSPHRRYPQLHHDIGFSDTVSNVVEIVKHEHQRAAQRHKFPRGKSQWLILIVLSKVSFLPKYVVIKENNLFIGKFISYISNKKIFPSIDPSVSSYLNFIGKEATLKPLGMLSKTLS